MYNDKMGLVITYCYKKKKWKDNQHKLKKVMAITIGLTSLRSLASTTFRNKICKTLIGSCFVILPFFLARETDSHWWEPTDH